MPEILEVETYRAHLEQSGLGRTIVGVRAPDPWYLKGGLNAGALRDALVGRSLEQARRRGKLLLADTSGGGPTLGVRFGMTGRLLIDGESSIHRLEYASNRDERAWDRFVLELVGGGELRVHDPRRLGGVELDPDEARLGPDALSLTVRQLRAALGTSEVAVKARLMDQSRIAGLGNLLTDEALFRAGIDPARPASSLQPGDVAHLHRHLRATLRTLQRRGGSHTGDIQVARVRGGTCPIDGAPLDRRTIAGRTTYSCPVHQR